MRSLPTKDEILKKFYFLEDSPDKVNKYELWFSEGGRETWVFSYSSRNEAQCFWEEDAIHHWSSVLKRGYDNGS